jgi:hypothetical protein
MCEPYIGSTNITKLLYSLRTEYRALLTVTLSRALPLHEMKGLKNLAWRLCHPKPSLQERGKVANHKVLVPGVFMSSTNFSVPKLEGGEVLSVPRRGLTPPLYVCTVGSRMGRSPIAPFKRLQS